MASNYTCRACSRAILGRSSIIPRSTHVARPLSCQAPQAQRGLATTTRSTEPKEDRPPKKPQLTKTGKKLSNILASTLREKAPVFTETYYAYGNTQELFKECSRPGDYTIPQSLEKGGEIPTDENGVHLGEGTGWWYDTLGLAPTFANWGQITFIHMYMLQVRFRMFPATHAPIWVQHLTNHAFYAAEDRLAVFHKFSSNSLRQKYLKDMFANWRAVLLSYDEGIVKGDAVLAAAVWRNLFGAREDVDFQKLAQVVGYMRKEIRRLDVASDEEVASGHWKFAGDPGAEAEAVRKPSKLMHPDQKE